MILLYYYANVFNYLVAETSDRSDLLLGFFTKHGDDDADFPIRGLSKTQVRALAHHLALPERTANKPSDPQLYPSQKLMDELPHTYQNLDPLLVGLFDRLLTPAAVRRQTTTPLSIV